MRNAAGIVGTTLGLLGRDKPLNSVNRDPGAVIAALNPRAWYRYGLGIIESGSKVSTWADRSGNGNNLTQASGAAQPTLQADGTILFDGSAHYMQAAFTLDQPCTIYVRLKQVSWIANDYLMDGGAAPNSGMVRQALSGASPQVELFAGGGVVGPVSQLAIGTYGTLVARINGASSLLQIDSNTGATGDAGASNPSGFTIGAEQNNSNFSNIQVKEIAIFPVAHDATTISDVVGYMGNL